MRNGLDDQMDQFKNEVYPL